MPEKPASLKAFRSSLLDTYRGLGVLLMMIFHFSWDLGNFGFIEFSLANPFWNHFRDIIVTIFISAVGWSAYLTMQKHHSIILWKRDLKLLLAIIIISLGTYLAFPNNWIYFGILHFIFLLTFLVRPMTKWPIISFIIGVIIVLIYNTTNWLSFPSVLPYIVHTLHLPTSTLDIAFPFPWIGVALIGIALGYFKIHQLPIPEHFVTRILAWMGRYALPIYLLHQLILFTLVASAKMVLSH
ncbi:hypothetical protein MSP8887_01889 [Marinomonas spartinae]|uniref:heparan-alpha-glucosaminide N-acetyltransferase n=1 Tax=Marinomonas spartinae TaxID=1792290 RepID=UPI000808EC24|nr:heparan-alpha-glucosaminide N-acetyltransferase [Marinomonas spartinae]SBS33222.1 hypothetical protein MSP8887_01889 [Marinomonas spartinae]